LDAVDIDGAVQIDNTVTVGVDGTGKDVKFFGDTATNGYMLWDESTDDLILGNTGTSKLGVGIATPDNIVHIYAGDATQTSSTSFTQLTVEHSANSGINILSGASSNGTIYFGDSGSASDGILQYDHDTRALALGAAGSVQAYVTSGGILSVGDNANANMTKGITINQGTADNFILDFKSSDIAHGRTSFAETDSYFYMKKADATGGGLEFTVVAEDAGISTVALFQSVGGQAPTTASASDVGLFTFFAQEHDGSNGAANVTANGNVFSIRARVGGANRTVFNVDEDGDISYDGSDAGAYDYAEMFEWKDGNPDSEERQGYSVVLDGDKIRKAEGGEIPIGIVSVKPAVCGDHPNEWHKTWKTDEWGRKIYKEVPCVKFEIQHESEPATYYKEGDELPEGKEIGDEKSAAVYITKEKHYEGDGIPDDLPDDAESYTKLVSQYSDEYDEEQDYSIRAERKEWSPIGLMGKLRMRSGQPTASSWIKMKDEGNDIEMWLVK